MFTTRLRRSLGTAIASLFVAGALAVPAQAVTFNFLATGLFEDEFILVSDTGTLSGSFEAEDTSMNGLLEASEITAFTVTTSGFAGAGRNFSFDNTNGTALVDNSGTTNEIATGFSAGLIDFSSDDFNFVVQLDLQLALPNFAASFFSALDPDFALLRNEDFTINGETFPGPSGEIPLPAGLPLLLGGLSLIGVLGRRRGKA